MNPSLMNITTSRFLLCRNRCFLWMFIGLMAGRASAFASQLFRGKPFLPPRCISPGFLIRQAEIDDVTKRRLLCTNNSNDGLEQTPSELTLEIPTAEDTEEVGALFSAIVLQSQPRGSTIFLDGDLGAGKTAFARGFLRAATGNDDLRVTSPTYLLVNVYPVGDLEIHHMDLYRLAGEPENFLPLNLRHVFDNCVSLIEWPQRLGEVPIPEDRLDISIRIPPDDANTGGEEDEEDDIARIMTLHPRGSLWKQRIESIKEEGLLDDLVP